MIAKNNKEKIIHMIQKVIQMPQSVYTWFILLSKKQKIKVAIVSLAVILVLAMSLFSTSKDNEEKIIVRTISLISLSSSTPSTAIPLAGEVKSISEASVRAESSGAITLYKKLGDYVYAGQSIGSFPNALERASVTQAEGAYEASKSSKVNSGNTLEETKAQAMNTIFSVSSSLEDVVYNKTDQAYKTPDEIGIRLEVTVPDARLVSILETQRTDMGKILEKRKVINDRLRKENIDTTTLISELSLLQKEVTQMQNYLNNLAEMYVKALPEDTKNEVFINSGRANVAQGRALITAMLSQISVGKMALNTQMAQSDGTHTEVSMSDASIKQALGMLQQAQARLAKTVVYSPISGTINALPAHNGDFISIGSPIAIVSNNGELVIETHISEDDMGDIHVGDKAIIDNEKEGVVSFIASAIDPLTKKIKCTIAFTEEKNTHKEINKKLVNGQSVRISLIRKEENSTENKNNAYATSTYKVPSKIALSGVKLTPKGAFVFVFEKATSTPKGVEMNASSTIGKVKAKEITLGRVLGDEVIILKGLEGLENIVKDARGLKDNQEVLIINK